VKKIEIYTDGSCNNNGNKNGGWGVVILYRGEIIKLSGRQTNTTSNRMEMMAMLVALTKVNKSKLSVDEVIIRSDSQYAIKIFNGSWKASSNVDLLDEFNQLHVDLNNKGTTIKFEWVKGHAGDTYNEMADQLANCNIQQEEVNGQRLPRQQEVPSGDSRT